MPSKTPPSKTSQQPGFESTIERLEEIVGQMENEKLPLETLLVRYEEGIQLVKICSEKLDAAEKKIEIVTRDAAGKPGLTEFEPEQKESEEKGGTALF